MQTLESLKTNQRQPESASESMGTTDTLRSPTRDSFIVGQASLPEVYARLAQVQAVRGRYQSVIGTFLELVGLLLENGSLEQAERFLQQTLTLQPESRRAREQRIELERKRGNIEQAVELSRELARLCIEQGDGERSIRLLQATLGEQPDNLDIALELADMFVAHGHIADGAAAFRRVAESFETTCRPARAVEAYRRLKVVQSDDCQVMLTLGRLYIGLGQYEEAEKELRAVLRHDLENEQALLQLGWVCQLTGRVRSGILAFSKVLQSQPHHPVANRKLAELHFSQGMMTEAVTGFATAALGYLGAESVDEAIVCYRHILAIEPGNGAAGQALLQLEGSFEGLEIARPGLVIVPLALDEGESTTTELETAISQPASPALAETEPPEPRPELLCENSDEPPSRPRLVRRGLLKAEFGEKLARPEKKGPAPVRHGLVGKPMGGAPVSDKPLLPSPKPRPCGPASPRPEPVSALPDESASSAWRDQEEDFAEELADDFGQHLFDPEPVSVWQPESSEVESEERAELAEDFGQRFFDPEPTSLFEDEAKNGWGSLFDDWDPQPPVASLFVDATSEIQEPLFSDETVDEDVLVLFPIETCEPDQVSEEAPLEEALFRQAVPGVTQSEDASPVEEASFVNEGARPFEDDPPAIDEVSLVPDEVKPAVDDILLVIDEALPLFEDFVLEVEDVVPAVENAEDELFEMPLVVAHEEPAPVDLPSAQQRAEVSQARAVENLESGLEGADASSLMAAYRSALTETPDNLVLRTRLADLYLKYGFLEEAVSHYREVLDQQPDAAYALRRIVQAELWGERYKEVTDTLLSLAELSLASGRSGEAVEALQDVLALDPEHCPAVERMADLFLWLAQENLACHHLRQLAETALSQGDLASAMGAFGRLVDVAEASPSPIPLSAPGLAAGRYINLLLRRGQVLEAGRTLQRLERSGAEGAEMCGMVIQAAKAELGAAGLETQFQYGELCYLAGHLDRAIEAFQQTRRYPDYERASTSRLGQCFAAKGGPMMAQLAIRQFAKALTLPGMTAWEEAEVRHHMEQAQKVLDQLSCDPSDMRGCGR